MKIFILLLGFFPAFVYAAQTDLNISHNTSNNDNSLKPLSGLEAGGITGSIESITYDGKRYYFCASGDRVVSPITSKTNEIIYFSEVYMEKTTGKVSRTHWAKEVLWSIDGSELASDIGDRDFKSKNLNNFKKLLINVKLNNTTNKDIKFPYHLLWLLGASIDWDEVTLNNEMIHIGKKLGYDRPQEDWLEIIESSIDIISGKKSKSNNVTISEVSKLLQACFHGLHAKIDPSWRMLLTEVVSM